jgi:hypothetical protein
MGVGLIHFEDDADASWSVSTRPVNAGWSDYCNESGFQIVRMTGTTGGVIIPHWFAVLLTGIIAAALGIRRPFGIGKAQVT